MMQRNLTSRTVRPRAFGSAGRRLAVQVRADNCLIVNCKSGGHAFIGYYLAKALQRKGHSVTILNDGDKVMVHKRCSCRYMPPLSTALSCDWMSCASTPDAPSTQSPSHGN